MLVIYLFFALSGEAIRLKEPVGKKVVFTDFHPHHVFSSHIQNEREKPPVAREWLLNGSTFQRGRRGISPLPGQLRASFSKHLTWFWWRVECVTALISRRAPSCLCGRCSIPKRTRLPAAKEPGDLLLCLGPQVPAHCIPMGAPLGFYWPVPGTPGILGSSQGMLVQVSTSPL